MNDADKKLRKFDTNVLYLPKSERNRHVQKVQGFIKLLRSKLAKLPDVNVRKYVIAGSIAKQTILKRTNNKPIDVDLVLIIAKKKNTPTPKKLIGQIKNILISLYRNKNSEDFKVKNKAITVTFKNAGLDIDIVPALEVENKPNVADQFVFGSRKPIRTCASCQVEFIKKCQKNDPDFRILVRLAKKWRDNAKLYPLNSYTIELILAHLHYNGRLKGNLEEKFMKFLNYFAKTKLKERISFTGTQSNQTKLKGSVIIVDPFCVSNNVAQNIEENDRRLIVKKATKACNAHKMASNKNDISIWKQIFGPEFSNENLM